MSTPQIQSATGTPARPRQNNNGSTNGGANHRHSKSTSNVAGAPKRANQGNRNHSSQYLKHGNQISPNHGANSYHNNGPKSAGFQPSYSDNENVLSHTRSEPMPSVMAPSTPPRQGTPSKNSGQEGNNSSSNSNQQSQEKKGRKRRGQKRPKDLNTAAAANADMPGSQLPTATMPPMPQTAKPFGTPGKHYAGPTFHHSPAPSALPMPSFFSKSVPSTPNGPSLSNMMSSSDSSDESDSTPSTEEEKKEESPLAKLFRADSEERAAKKKTQRQFLFDDNPFKSRSTSNLPRSQNVAYGDHDSTPGTPGNGNGGVDLMFAMDSVKTDKARSPEADDVQKRKEKANALKEILLQHAPPESPETKLQQPMFPSSPSPKPRAGDRHLSPEVPFNRSFTKTHTHPPAGYSPSGTPTKNYTTRQSARTFNENSPAPDSPKKILTRSSSDNSSQKDPKVIEDYLRWALKIDTPNATGVRG